MGYYINPTDKTKEAFLGEHGTKITKDEALAADYLGDAWPVCLVDNGAFTAAAISYDVMETQAFLQPDDYRDKQWFLVKRELLKPYCNKA